MSVRTRLDDIERELSDIRFSMIMMNKNINRLDMNTLDVDPTASLLLEHLGLEVERVNAHYKLVEKENKND